MEGWHVGNIERKIFEFKLKDGQFPQEQKMMDETGASTNKSYRSNPKKISRTPKKQMR